MKTNQPETSAKKSVEEIERDLIAKILIKKSPKVGDRFARNGLVYIVTFSAPRRGKVNLELLGITKEAIDPESEVAFQPPQEPVDSSLEVAVE